MADISCPSCGKLNPAGLDECQFCHAELVLSEASSPLAVGGNLSPGEEALGEISADPEPAPQDEDGREQAEIDSPEAGSGADTPEWLRRIRIRHASEQPAKTASSEFSDWLDPERQADDTVPSVPLGDTEPEPVEVPGAPEVVGGETSPEQFLRVQPPSAFSYNLRITSTQHAHADLLDSIVAAEGSAVPLSRRKDSSASPLLRWGIAAILFLSILGPIVTNRQLSPLPAFTEEAAQVNNLIEQLPGEASVLLAFDYDPGFSGELDAAAAAVVDHLISRGAYLTLVSTIPTGPVLAERFISGTVGHNNLVRNIHYVNLGFIPGGPTGLLSFAEDPQRTLPYSLDGETAWSGDGGAGRRSVSPPLVGIDALADFNLVLILVDDSFTARSWIEQVQSRLVGESFQTPLVMVVSAQVEPLVRPYYDADPRQVQGFITGLRGGTAYEQMTGRKIMPGYYWDAYIFGMSMAGLLVLIGALVGIAFTLFDRRGQDQGEGRA
jgi:hypothetical protein